MLSCNTFMAFESSGTIVGWIRFPRPSKTLWPQAQTSPRAVKAKDAWQAHASEVIFPPCVSSTSFRISIGFHTTSIPRSASAAPASPFRLLPHAYNFPEAVSTITWFAPQATSLPPSFFGRVTRTGTSEEEMWLPTPNWPHVLLPQVCSSPFSVSVTTKSSPQ